MKKKRLKPYSLEWFYKKVGILAIHTVGESNYCYDVEGFVRCIAGKLKNGQQKFVLSIDTHEARLHPANAVLAGMMPVDELSSAEKIKAIERWQADPKLHPLTCGNLSSHRLLVPAVKGGEVALVCLDCEYKQSGIPDVVFDMYRYQQPKRHTHDK